MGGVRRMLNGHHQSPDLQVVLDKFIKIYVLCPTCALPEIGLKGQKREGIIKGKCNACGFDDVLKPASEHRFASAALKSLCETAGKGGSSKQDRRAKKQQKAQNGGGGSDESDDLDNDDLDMSDFDSDEDGKSKKKKKEKKEKKDKKEKKKGKTNNDSDDDESTNSEEEGSKVSSPEIKELVNTVGSQIKAEGVENEIEKITDELRLQGISLHLPKKMLSFVMWESFFGTDSEVEIGLKGVRSQGKLIQSMVKGLKLGVPDIMWGLEVFTAEHDTVKALAGVAKSLYELEIFDEKNFLPYYNSKDAGGNPGHEEVHKALKPFAEWLQDDSDSDSDDSD